MRVAILSLHTSPLQQPGQGDAGGLNVYVRQLSRQLAGRGIDVEIFTADPQTASSGSISIGPRLRVHNLDLRRGRLTKEDLPGLIPQLAREIAAHPAAHDIDVIHAHYWISGAVGVILSDLWEKPLAVTMHTLAAVKNLAVGHRLESAARQAAENAVIARADAVIANTVREREELIALAHAHPSRIHVVAPGVDIGTFHPGDKAASREAVGLSDRDLVVLFVGRLQHVKGPDVALEALAELTRTDPALAARATLAILGAPSGTDDMLQRCRRLAAAAGLRKQIVFEPPVPAETLADWYRAADAVVVPSRSESFGLVAAEASASGTVVIAADVGGLPEIVEHEQTGLCVSGHEPGDWAAALARVLGNAEESARWGRRAVTKAKSSFDWRVAAVEIAHVYDTVAAAAKPPCTPPRIREVSYS